MNFELKLNPPFDSRPLLELWSRNPGEQINLVQGNSFRRLFFRGERPVLLSIEFAGETENPLAKVTLEGKANDRDRTWAEETTRWILHDHLPLTEFYAHIINTDPSFTPLVRRFRGLKLPLSPTLFETLVYCIVGQQVNMAFADGIKATLEQRYSRRAEIDGCEYLAALAPEDFEGAEIADLRAMKISNSKSRSIIELAEAFRKNPLDRHILQGKSSEELLTILTQFRGIGPWSAESATMFSLGRLDVLPAGDVGLQKAVQRLRGLAERPTEEEVREIGRRWAPYQALAVLYLWRSLKTE